MVLHISIFKTVICSRIFRQLICFLGNLSTFVNPTLWGNMWHIVHTHTYCFKCWPTFLWNVSQHFVFKPSSSRHPHSHLKWRFEKYRLTFPKKIDMSVDFSGKYRPTFGEKPNVVVGLKSWSNWEISTMVNECM